MVEIYNITPPFWLRKWPAAVAGLALLVTACATPGAKPGSGLGLADAGLTSMLAGVPEKRLGDPYIRAAVKALEEGRLKDAGAGFNRALKFDPQNARLHFLNGLVYHLRAERGDAGQYEMAEVGYRLALQFDPGDAPAARQIGHLKFRQQRFREAQNAFAYALLIDPGDAGAGQGLAVSSYFAQDLKTAVAAVTKAILRTPSDPGALRTAAMVAAARGDFVEADGFRDRYLSAASAKPYQAARLQSRIRDWKRLYQRRPGMRQAQFTESQTKQGLDPPEAGEGGSGENRDGDQEDPDKQTSKPVIPRMALVDVTIIRSEERRATDKGINLLSGLQISMTGDFFDFKRARSHDLDAGTKTTSRQNDNNLKLSFPTSGITYNLNIFNDNDDRNEVLARPTLVALDGKASEFFSGASFHVALDGAAGSEGSVTEVPVGLRLRVTPRFIDDDTVELSVDAARAFLESRSSNVGFANFAQISKTTLNANVALKFGETMVLSGLSEREDEFLKDGVPFLKDIPGVQYLFGHEDTLEFKKSVLILLTPRNPSFVHRDGTPKVSRDAPADARADQSSLGELKQRPGWFKPASHLDAVFEHLKDRKLFKEFRAGDVALEDWDNPESLATDIKRSLQFLYF
ncbi:MAG: hypothetical protein ISR51_08120 [Rhodospirillales bacterium]|nr:hypothetical protein [Alphaproteobacteria bacterium]MBL6948628.1 hypothetical protein [Rhodospirillales bacterium]